MMEDYNQDRKSDSRIACFSASISSLVKRWTEVTTHIIDHGGLIRIQDDFYQTESVVRQHLQIDEVDKIDEKGKEKTAEVI